MTDARNPRISPLTSSPATPSGPSSAGNSIRPDGHMPADTHRLGAIGASTSPADHPPSNTHWDNVSGGPNVHDGQNMRSTQSESAVVNERDRSTANGCSEPSARTPSTDPPTPISPVDQGRSDTHPNVVNGGPNVRDGQSCSDTQASPAFVNPGDRPMARELPTPLVGTPRVDPFLEDPVLNMAAEVLDDLERVKIANQNRLRQLTRSEDDKDGKLRGFGLTLDHPDVERLAKLVEALEDAEKFAAANLTRMLKKHPLGPWVKARKGVGERQAARLLATLGDPYIRPELKREGGTVEPRRPRRVSELWAYTGYHTISFRIGQRWGDNQTKYADPDPTSTRQSDVNIQEGRAGGINFTDHVSSDTHGVPVGEGQASGDSEQSMDATQSHLVGIAAVRRRNHRANWSAAAKMRTWNISDSILKQVDKSTCEKRDGENWFAHAEGCRCAPYRKVYDAARVKYHGSVHPVECVRCGPKGKPALMGSPRSDAHLHAMAMRIVSKTFLKDLWREAKRLHEESE